MKIAIIHDTKRIRTGAHHINDLIVSKLRQRGVHVREFYPKGELMESSHKMKGLANILFFFSLLEHKEEIVKCDLIQGTTYTPLTYLAFPIPVVSHFGSTTYGYLKETPRANSINAETKEMFYKLKKDRIIPTLNLKSWKFLRDVEDIEQYVAKRAEGVIATSKMVKEELVNQGISEEKIDVIHNAIEDYWYESETLSHNKFGIVYLGRIGDDPFTWKLKGVDRLIHLFQNLPQIPKHSFLMSNNIKMEHWLSTQILNNRVTINMGKRNIKSEIAKLKGNVIFLPSRYEGFSLSLVEGMSQGLIPVTYPVGVIPEIIKNGVNGFLVNSQKEAIFAIERLRTNIRLRSKIADNAIITSQAFKAEVMVEKLIPIYKKIIKQSVGHKRND